MTVRVDDLRGSAREGGILIRQNTSPDSKIIYLRYNAAEDNIKVLSGNSSVNILPAGNLLNNVGTVRYLKVRRWGNKVQLFASTNGTNYSKLFETDEIKGELLVGLAASDIPVSGNNSVQFSEFSLVPYSDMTPINMLLLN